MSAIDYSVLNTLKQRMKDKFPVLLQGYLRDAKAYLVSIEANLPSGDVGELIGAAHSLKSASGLLGVLHVHHHAETLEYAGKGLQDQGLQSYASLVPLYEALQNAFSAVESDLRVELEKLT